MSHVSPTTRANLRPTAITLATVAALIALLGACAEPPVGPAAPFAEVIEVIDGDTVLVRSGSHTESIRLLGIDTPEVAHHGQSAECFGPEASERTMAIVPPGTVVHLARDVEARDAYGRVLAYVTGPDGTNVNLLLAAEGYATPLAISPNFGLADTINALVDHARSAGVGLWGTCENP